MLELQTRFLVSNILEMDLNVLEILHIFLETTFLVQCAMGFRFNITCSVCSSVNPITNVLKLLSFVESIFPKI